MKLANIFEEFKSRYEAGDKVNTALGDGVIKKLVNMGQRGEHLMFQPGKEAQKKFNLEDKPYKMNFSEVHKHI